MAEGAAVDSLHSAQAVADIGTTEAQESGVDNLVTPVPQAQAAAEVGNFGSLAAAGVAGTPELPGEAGAVGIHKLREEAGVVGTPELPEEAEAGELSAANDQAARSGVAQVVHILPQAEAQPLEAAAARHLGSAVALLPESVAGICMGLRELRAGRKMVPVVVLPPGGAEVPLLAAAAERLKGREAGAWAAVPSSESEAVLALAVEEAGLTYVTTVRLPARNLRTQCSSTFTIPGKSKGTAMRSDGMDRRERVE